MISSLFGLSHGIVTQEQFFLLVATVSRASGADGDRRAVFFLRHLLPESDRRLQATPRVEGLSEEE